MERHKLSKSTYIRGLQCTKSLYLHKKRPFLRDKLSAEQRAKFSRGHNIGDMAHQLFPGGINMAPKSPSQYPKAVANTAEAVNDNAPVIYEATFQHNKTLVMLDILNFKDGKYFGYEVKSSLGISDTYIQDAALQYWVITNSGIEFEDFFLVTVNPDYEYKLPFVPEDYFVFTSVLEKITPLQEKLKAQTTSLISLLDEKHSPKKTIGAHCNKPYPCDFKSKVCWKKVPKLSVFSLRHLDDTSKYSFYLKGLETPESIESEVQENEMLIKEIQLIKENKTVISSTLQEKFNNTPTLLFAGITKPAFPLFEGSRPYEQTVFIAGIRKGDQQDIRLFKSAKDGFEFINNIIDNDDNVISLSPLPEAIDPISYTSIIDEIENLNIFIPELVGLSKIDEIITKLNPSVKDNPYDNIFFASGGWEKMIQEKSEMDDVIDGLEKYIQCGLDAITAIIHLL